MKVFVLLRTDGESRTVVAALNFARDGLDDALATLLVQHEIASFDLIIIAAFVAAPLWNAPGTGASGARVSAYAQHYASRSTAALLIYSIAMGLFLCFAAGLWAWLREREGAPHALSSVFAFAAIALVILILAAFVPGYMLSYRTQPSVIAGPLADLGFGLLALSGLPTALCLATAFCSLALAPLHKVRHSPRSAPPTNGRFTPG